MKLLNKCEPEGSWRSAVIDALLDIQQWRREISGCSSLCGQSYQVFRKPGGEQLMPFQAFLKCAQKHPN
jgi:hypothetical protein